MHPNFRVTKLIAFACGIALLTGMGSIPAAAKTKHKSHKQTTSASAKSGKAAKSSKGAKSKKSYHGKTARTRGQQVIASDRARQIQEALIREHYMSGEPTGNWDQSTREALVKYQGDNGWQTKVVPDSRALIKLGLGPDRSATLNPDALNRPDAARDSMPGGGRQ